MIGTIIGSLSGISDAAAKRALRNILGAGGIGGRLVANTVTTPGLTIKAGASALVKAATAHYLWFGDRLVAVAANTDMAALSGTVLTTKFNVYCFFTDRAGTQTSAMGVEGATLAAVKFPPIPEGKAMPGFVIINPTGTGSFVGGTTAIDDATVIPGALYVNTVGIFDPSIQL